MVSLPFVDCVVQSFEMKRNINTGLFIGIVYVLLDQCNSVFPFLEKRLFVYRQEIKDKLPLSSYYETRRSIVVFTRSIRSRNRSVATTSPAACTW